MYYIMLCKKQILYEQIIFTEVIAAHLTHVTCFGLDRTKKGCYGFT